MKKWLALVLLIVPVVSVASDLTAVADSTMGLLNFTSKIMLATAGSIGLALLVGAFLKYQSYKENAMQSPLSGVIVLFVLALLFFGICALIIYNDRPDIPAPTQNVNYELYR